MKCCERCGKPLIGDYDPRGFERRKYCHECSPIVNIEKTKAAQKKYWHGTHKRKIAKEKVIKVEKKKVTNTLSVQEVCKLARAEKMTYGKYVEKYL